MTAHEIPFGSFTDPDGITYQVAAELRITPAQLIGHGQTVDHEPIPPDALEVSIVGSTYRATVNGARDLRYRDIVSGGQNLEDFRRVPRARRLVRLWEAWHLNGMRPGCAHQGEAWTCTRDLNAGARAIAERIGAELPPTQPCGTVNGWRAIRERHGEHPYPYRGDQCDACGRDRWDEPSDHCPVTGYRWGSAWLFEPVPPGILDELRRMFREEVPA